MLVLSQTKTNGKSHAFFATSRGKVESNLILKTEIWNSKSTHKNYVFEDILFLSLLYMEVNS